MLHTVGKPTLRRRRKERERERRWKIGTSFVPLKNAFLVLLNQTQNPQEQADGTVARYSTQRYSKSKVFDQRYSNPKGIRTPKVFGTHVVLFSANKPTLCASSLPHLGRSLPYPPLGLHHLPLTPAYPYAPRCHIETFHVEHNTRRLGKDTQVLSLAR